MTEDDSDDRVSVFIFTAFVKKRTAEVRAYLDAQQAGLNPPPLEDVHTAFRKFRAEAEADAHSDILRVVCRADTFDSM